MCLIGRENIFLEEGCWGQTKPSDSSRSSRSSSAWWRDSFVVLGEWVVREGEAELQQEGGAVCALTSERIEPHCFRGEDPGRKRSISHPLLSSSRWQNSGGGDDVRLPQFRGRMEERLLKMRLRRVMSSFSSPFVRGGKMDVASPLFSSHRSPPSLRGGEGLRKMGLIVAPLFSLPPPPIRGSRALRQTICCALPLPPQPRRK